MSAAALLAACAVGPAGRVPDPPALPRVTETPLPETTAGGEDANNRAQRFVTASAVAPEWWRLLGSPALDRLVAQALMRSPTLEAAQAALQQARELAEAQRGGFLPSLQLQYAPTRGRVPDDSSSPLSSGASIYTLHTAQLSVGYVADVFGGNRRAVESLDAQTDAMAWQLVAARLSLAANVVAAALQEASLREQLAATDRLADIASRQLGLLQAQRRLGVASGANVLSQEALLRQTEASTALLRKQLAQARNLMAMLGGGYPADASVPSVMLPDLALPDLPVAVPAKLVEQRPDVRVAAAQLRSANAQIGVAISNMLPQLTITANAGSSAETFGQLFGTGGLLWNIGANVAQPLFQGGSLLHRKRAAEEQWRAALAQYQGTVLVAFQNVADALEAARHDADAHVASIRQEEAARHALQIAERQLALGDISVLTLLNSETSYLQATLARTQAQTNRYLDVAAVYQSLGGGPAPQ
jgi:NodT family efflux transporter outer membrane factor (OMF) lipoprotein